MTARDEESRDAPALPRVVGVPGAVLLGLGSILGTGIFVSVGLAAGIAGPSVVLAIALAAVVATCNGLSSAQLAATYPVSGGTYEYGYRLLGAPLGFTAGWLFLCAKSASAATAALGFSGYALATIGVDDARARSVLAALAVVAITLIVAGGMRRSNRVNAVIVACTVGSLAAFVGLGAAAIPAGFDASAAISVSDPSALLHATALMFVAYTGYGRIATLGEEVRDPRRSIPRAVVIALAVSMLLYLGVALVAVAAVGAHALGEATRDAAPLQLAALRIHGPGLATLVAAGAIAAMLGVLLNLVLGLSRVLLAMARRRDMPRALARVDDRGSPRIAVVVVGVGIAALTMIGSVRTTWSFSAFTVLAYYAITNLAALRLPAADRRYPRWIAALGLLACLGLAPWVELEIWLAGLGVIGGGLVWRAIARRWARIG